MTKAGPTVAVSVDSSTMFGTKAAPATSSTFAVGDIVAEIGKPTGDTLLAARVVRTAGGAGANPAPSVGPNT
ncbi:MAG: hypothetical protein V4479_02825 [Actinomycetota bacterium]